MKKRVGSQRSPAKKREKPSVSPAQQERRLRRLLTTGAGLAAFCLAASLILYFFPAFPGQAAAHIKQGIAWVQTSAARAGSSFQSLAARHREPPAKPGTQQAPSSQKLADQTPLEIKPEKGQAADLDMEQSTGQDAGSVYTSILGTSLGPMIYYNQSDDRWGSYLYGGSDPMSTYGCGPTTVAMLVHSLSPSR